MSCVNFQLKVRFLLIGLGRLGARHARESESKESLEERRIYRERAELYWELSAELTKAMEAGQSEPLVAIRICLAANHSA